MEKEPLVSIIITSYNHSRYIIEAVESALNQTYKNIEIIVVDDGSKDNTHELLNNKYKTNSLVKLLLHSENRGYAFRANESIKLTNGDFISFLSSDDWYLPKKIEKQVEKFKTLDNSYGVVYSGGYRYFEDTQKMIEVDINNNMRAGWILKNLLVENFFIYPISPLFKKECFIKYPFTEKYKAEGEAIHFKIAMSFKYEYVKDILVVMRDHEFNTGKNIEQMLNDNISYRKDIFAHSDFPQELKYLEGRTLAQIYKLNGWELMRIKKDYKTGKAALMNAVQYDKSMLLNPRVLIGLFLSILHTKLSG